MRREFTSGADVEKGENLELEWRGCEVERLEDLESEWRGLEITAGGGRLGIGGLLDGSVLVDGLRRVEHSLCENSRTGLVLELGRCWLKRCCDGLGCWSSWTGWIGWIGWTGWTGWTWASDSPGWLAIGRASALGATWYRLDCLGWAATRAGMITGQISCARGWCGSSAER